MPKIYNEIVIDMNPESPTFEETLYEDSFDYDGDMMLMQTEDPTTLDPEGQKGLATQYGPLIVSKGKYYLYMPPPMGKGYIEHSPSEEDKKKFKQIATGEELFATGGEEGGAIEVTEKWGAANITKDDFIDPDTGQPRSNADVLKLIKPKLPGINEAALLKQIMDMAPKFQKADEKEKGFLAAEKGFEDRATDISYGQAGVTAQRAEDAYGLGTKAAGRAKEAGLGQLQQQAGQLGAQMRGAYGGMGGGMRGAIGGQAAMAKGVGTTYDVYGDEMTRLGQERGYAQDIYGFAGQAADLAKDKAAHGLAKGEYGLEKGATGDFEAAISDWVDPTWLVPQAREGGRVPSKESFSHFLTKLPDAGGS